MFHEIIAGENGVAEQEQRAGGAGENWGTLVPPEDKKCSAVISKASRLTSENAQSGDALPTGSGSVLISEADNPGAKHLRTGAAVFRRGSPDSAWKKRRGGTLLETDMPFCCEAQIRFCRRVNLLC